MDKYPKRLIEVDLPIKRISAHARREKSIRHGHISTLHIWWARRPLAACRAVVCAALWPDPADPLCPQDFRNAAAKEINTFIQSVVTTKTLYEMVSEESLRRYQQVANKKLSIDPGKGEGQINLRTLLLDFIADFAAWEASTEPHFLETSRRLTQFSHEALGGEKGTRPLVVDPFAGGGTIPLEALRIGADAFASDLNPVAVLLNKVVLEYIPKYGQKLADEVRKWGQWVKEQAEKELNQFYPKDSDGATPIAYLWARTIQCEGPGCGTEIPLMRSLWLAKKGSRSVALKIIPRRPAQRIDFQIISGAKASEVGEGTVKRGSATCPCCGYTTPVTSVRAQLRSRKGGAGDARMFAVVTTRQGQQGRFYRLSNEADHKAICAAKKELTKRQQQHSGSMTLIPDEPLPPQGTLGFRVQLYGMLKWGDLFAPRQLLALTTFTQLVREVGRKISSQKDKDLSEAIQTCLALAVDRLADKNASLTVWNTVGEKIEHVFGRQALPIAWDFPEVGIFSDSTGNWMSHINLVAEGAEGQEFCCSQGQVERASATQHPLPDDSALALVTDPPYYDAVPYSDLSDFFYVWLKRTLPTTLVAQFSGELTPKDEECIVDEIKGKDRRYFEKTMALAMAEGRRILQPSGIGLVVFAHKSTAGWEAQLQAMVDAGWTMTGSWPIDTERPGRLRAQDSAALASSVHLICRPRETQDGKKSEVTGDWRDILNELPRRIHEWMPRLAREGVVGADAIFSCLGPALEVFSRYSRVEKASGEQVTLKEYLEYVWAAVAKEALNMVFAGTDASGFEEDSRLTAMWLWTLSTGSNGNDKSEELEDETEDDDEEESSGKPSKAGGFILEFDAARKIAQGLGAHLEQLSHLVEIKGDKARLIPVSERTRYLFGKDQAQTPTQRKKKAKQMTFTDLEQEFAEVEGNWGEKDVPKIGQTVLDRVHQSMILFAAGRSDALKRFLVEEGIGKDQRFWRLAQAFSALYPKETDEKRWVDGVLARKKGLGL